ncbi:MAG: hypothetical protein PHQ04_08045 [Opitutaceae bacterium]|nr:hypothetical protein [Opitutaceae bacterium]
MIYHYRAIGHVQAHPDPLADPPPPSPWLALAAFGLSEVDLDTAFDPDHYLARGRMKLREIVASLRETYSGHICVECFHIQETGVRRFLHHSCSGEVLIHPLSTLL